jgi:glycosyltransferase involved in cell wall biosynthesis
LLSTSDHWAARRPLWDALPVLPWRNRRSPHWGNAWLGNGATRKNIREFSPDVTHLHWVNHGMLSLRDIARLKCPVVWTLHDSWVFTGGCHSPQECPGFRLCCGGCPELGSRREWDLSRWNWKRKWAVWEKADFTVVTPSRWLAEIAKSSSLLAGRRIETIPNAVDTSVFHPMDRASARAALGLPLETPLFFFGAHGALTDWNKGADLWRAALPAVADGFPGAEAVLAGASSGGGKMPLRVHELGVLTPEQMALAMAAADVVVVPSRMENLPNMVAESLACGTPVAAFAAGGIPEMVRHGETGFLAQPHDADDLAKGICQLLACGGEMRSACAASARESYTPETVARRHLELYASL